MREPLELIKECAIDHLTIHDNLTGEERDALKFKEPYDLFLLMYESMKSIIDDIKRSKMLKDLDAYKRADEQLWKHGHALIGFALAEVLGWLQNLELVRPKESKDERILVPYSIRFECGMVMSKEAVLDLATGELIRWDEIPIEAVNDTPIQEFIEFFTDDPNVLIEREVVTIEGRKMLRLTITDDLVRKIHFQGHEEMRVLLKRKL